MLRFLTRSKCGCDSGTLCDEVLQWTRTRTGLSVNWDWTRTWTGLGPGLGVAQDNIDKVTMTRSEIEQRAQA